MARKTIDFTGSDGRDVGKKYLITEMSASKAEGFAVKALLAMGKQGIEVPEGLGFVGLVQAGLSNLLKMDYELAAPILDEMMQCVEYIADPIHPEAKTKLTSANQDYAIEEVVTRFKLRKAIWDMHVEFFFTAK